MIPARGGSKRIPRKNVKPFFGKPIIAWSIEAALQSELFERVIVSTDDVEIAGVAEHFGAEVPFLRPAELADDISGTLPVFAHALESALKHDSNIKMMCGLHATAPFVSAKLLVETEKKFRSNDCDYLLGVTEFPFPIQRAVKLSSGGRLEMFNPEYYHTRSQDLRPAFHDAGQFYWGNTTAWLERKILFSNKSLGYALPREQVQDIDTDEDWKFAEILFERFQAAEKA